MKLISTAEKLLYYTITSKICIFCKSKFILCKIISRLTEGLTAAKKWIIYHSNLL